MAARDPANLTPEAVLGFLKESLKTSGFTIWLGAEPVECWNGRAELTIEVRPEMTQHHGYVHGAILGAAADNACAWAAASVAGDVVTGEYRVHFLSPAKGTRIRAVGEVVRAGRRQVVVKADVYAEGDGEARHVAIATATVIPVGDRER